MALAITESCVNCWACVDVCPNAAIAATAGELPMFAIDPQKCTECASEFSEAQCAAICPIECAIVDELGEALNPLGSLTGIPLEKLLAIRDSAREAA
ncbi:MAG: 4Fe-4S binding protein [Zoogloeaceae bacterium]|jgi:ferredoxin|nr:4Fe-4S binding protein [Zoogloeaceae bacterium]